MKYLVTQQHESFSHAKSLAKQKILNAFGFSGNSEASEDLNIFGQTDNDTMLLAISVIVQGQYSNHWESELTERLEILSNDLANGTIDNHEIWHQMTSWAVAQDLKAIRQNIESWGESVPNFEQYVHSCWTQNLELPVCNNVGEPYIINGITLICRSDGWDKANDQEILIHA